jgi:hypothetical protein
MLEITGPQLKPLAQLLLQFDRKGLVPDIYNDSLVINEITLDGIILSYPHRTYNERYFISRSGNVERKDVTFPEMSRERM